MDPVVVVEGGEAKPTCHVVAIPFPGRGHINPMINLCTSLASKTNQILVTLVVTEEWQTILALGSEKERPRNLCLATIPNVLMSERTRAGKFPVFFQQVLTQMEAPVDELLDKMDPPATVLVADTYLPWAFEMANRRDIPAASLFTMSLTVFSVLHYFDRFVQNGHFPLDLNAMEEREVVVDYIPGVPPTFLADMSMSLYGDEPVVRDGVLKSISFVGKSQYLLLCSIYELEAQQIDCVKQALLPSPVTYHIGPTIPYSQLPHSPPSLEANHYLEWLDSQPVGSVLYISQGSIHSTSGPQMEEIAAGVNKSRVRFLWVARGEVGRLKEKCGEMGLLVPWCDQLRVLCHPSVGGFWSHCGWSSTMESLFAGVPMLTFPLYGDQALNSKLIVEDWKVGWRVTSSRRRMTHEIVKVKGDHVAELVRRFLDPENEEAKEVRRRAKEVGDRCRSAVRKGGSSDSDMDNFIHDIIMERNK